MNDPCEKMQDTITDYILGALNRQEIDALHKHLSWFRSAENIFRPCRTKVVHLAG